MPELPDYPLTDKAILTLRNGSLFVNNMPFVVEYPTWPENQFDRIEDNKLVTLFRGHLENTWKPEEIEGYYA